MPLTRLPPGALVKGPTDAPDYLDNMARGLIASAISALPLDVGTVVFPLWRDLLQDLDLTA